MSRSDSFHDSPGFEPMRPRKHRGRCAKLFRPTGNRNRGRRRQRSSKGASR